MPCYVAPPRRQAPLYFAEVNYSKLGIEFQALDRDVNSRTQIVKQIRTGDIDAVRVLEVIEPCEEYPRGQCLDVTAELIAAAAKPNEPLEAEVLRGMLVDHERALKRESIFGW